MKTSVPSTRPHQRHTSTSAAAFSLVEVTIAVAIAALGFLTLLGLLPQGMNMARDSAEMSVSSKVVQKISGDLQSMAWSRITWTGYGPLRYFTNEGREMTRADTSAEDMTATLAYVAAVYVPEKPLDLVLPAGTASSKATTPETYLRRVKISVATTQDPAFDFTTASPTRFTSTYALIARMAD